MLFDFLFNNTISDEPSNLTVIQPKIRQRYMTSKSNLIGY